MEYKFKYTDESNENDYKVFFEVLTEELLHETIVELDGEIYLESHNGDEVEFRSLSENDKSAIIEQVEAWIDRERYEGGYTVDRYIDSMAEDFNSYGEG